MKKYLIKNRMIELSIDPADEFELLGWKITGSKAVAVNVAVVVLLLGTIAWAVGKAIG